jgi:hypothetical protein
MNRRYLEECVGASTGGTSTLREESSQQEPSDEPTVQFLDVLDVC